MANKQRGIVDIQLDKKRRLKFNMNALTELEDALGMPITGLSSQKVGMKELRAMLWAGLLHEDADLTLKEAGDLMEMEKLHEISEKVTEAMTIAFPQQGKKKKVSGPNGVGPKPNA
ncbi:hypothetical protein [Marininema halotolerans]|uniref:Phage tail assembly chaperone protein, TAC n=1 Tax=Marininema halotolerans TaxID=1155944 RepID=A0A1I6SGI4_9BACL|nr:hypothetical protein [Marininema halotolerans]SFS75858.1 hypothetical protein SAMN05444972_10757 [Marininema halotolerans]